MGLTWTITTFIFSWYLWFNLFESYFHTLKLPSISTWRLELLKVWLHQLLLICSYLKNLHCFTMKGKLFEKCSSVNEVTKSVIRFDHSLMVSKIETLIQISKTVAKMKKKWAGWRYFVSWNESGVETISNFKQYDLPSKLWVEISRDSLFYCPNSSYGINIHVLVAWLRPFLLLLLLFLQWQLEIELVRIIAYDNLKLMALTILR